MRSRARGCWASIPALSALTVPLANCPSRTCLRAACAEATSAQRLAFSAQLKDAIAEQPGELITTPAFRLSCATMLGRMSPGMSHVGEGLRRALSQVSLAWHVRRADEPRPRRRHGNGRLRVFAPFSRAPSAVTISLRKRRPGQALTRFPRPLPHAFSTQPFPTLLPPCPAAQ